jgi:hypothetical protein
MGRCLVAQHHLLFPAPVGGWVGGACLAIAGLGGGTEHASARREAHTYIPVLADRLAAVNWGLGQPDHISLNAKLTVQ